MLAQCAAHWAELSSSPAEVVAGVAIDSPNPIRGLTGNMMILIRKMRLFAEEHRIPRMIGTSIQDVVSYHILIKHFFKTHKDSLGHR